MSTDHATGPVDPGLIYDTIQIMLGVILKKEKEGIDHRFEIAKSILFAVIVVLLELGTYFYLKQ